MPVSPAPLQPHSPFRLSSWSNWFGWLGVKYQALLISSVCLCPCVPVLCQPHVFLCVCVRVNQKTGSYVSGGCYFHPVQVCTCQGCSGSYIYIHLYSTRKVTYPVQFSFQHFILFTVCDKSCWRDLKTWWNLSRRNFIRIVRIVKQFKKDIVVTGGCFRRFCQHVVILKMTEFSTVCGRTAGL